MNKRDLMTGPDLCRRLGISQDNLWYLVDRNVITAFFADDYTELTLIDDPCITESKDEFTTYMQRENFSANDVTQLVFSTRDVEKFEKKYQIGPHPTDVMRKVYDEIPLPHLPLKEDINLFDHQIWREAVRLYEVLLQTGLKNSDEHLQNAARKELTANKAQYKFIKKKHLKVSGLFAINPGHERRDFIGNLLKQIVKGTSNKSIGAQRLYQFGQEKYENHR